MMVLKFFFQLYVRSHVTTINVCCVLGEIKNVNIGRLLLCEATARLMEKGLEILGIKTVQKM